MKAPALSQIVDSALELTIVGSFTKIGYGARDKAFDWSHDLPDMSGQRVIITGATSGIGKATAAGIRDLGAEVHITSRSLERAQDAAFELNFESNDGAVFGHSLDTGDFDSILEFVTEIGKLDGGVDVLINNAGALSRKYKTDDRGTELTLSTHLIGPYLLMQRMLPLCNMGARILFMSSGGMYTQGLEVDDIEVSKADFKGAIAYAKAKRGQVEMVTHLAPKLAPDVILQSMHPGWVDTAGVDAGLPGFGKVMGPLLRTAEQGADTMVWLAATGGDGKPGQFWLDREPRRTAYIPGTGTDRAERQKLIEWLDLQILPAGV